MIRWTFAALFVLACASEDIQLRPEPDATPAADAPPAPACVCLIPCGADLHCRATPALRCDLGAGVCEEPAPFDPCSDDEPCGEGRACVVANDPARTCP